METYSAEKNGSPELSLAAVLDRIDRRLARLEDHAERMATVSRSAPAFVATLTDTVDGVAARLSTAGVDVDERARIAVDLVAQLTEPRTARALGALLGRIEALESLSRIAEGAPGAVATLADIVDGATTRLGEAGIDLDARARALLGLVERLTAPASTAAADALLDAGFLGPQAVAAITDVLHAMSHASEAPPASVGAWGAFRALGDPDVQRTVGFALAVAKKLGVALGRATPPQLPPHSTSR